MDSLELLIHSFIIYFFPKIRFTSENDKLQSASQQQQRASLSLVAPFISRLSSEWNKIFCIETLPPQREREVRLKEIKFGLEENLSDRSSSAKGSE